MRYFANPTSVAIPAMEAGVLGFIDTPKQGNRRPAGVAWCADNGCFSSKFNEASWFAFLERNAYAAADCLFAVAPDVVGDAAATLVRSQPWFAKIRALGYPVAFVAQDGIEDTEVPWDEFDALFVGGSTEFKLGDVARAFILEAKARGKYVHVGRVNSRKRFQLFAALEVAGVPAVDSVDGTYVTFAPRLNIHRLLTWVYEHRGDAAAAALHASTAKRIAATMKAEKAAKAAQLAAEAGELALFDVA
jgi:hypothetical protein